MVLIATRCSREERLPLRVMERIAVPGLHVAQPNSQDPGKKCHAIDPGRPGMEEVTVSLWLAGDHERDVCVDPDPEETVCGRHRPSASPGAVRRLSCLR